MSALRGDKVDNAQKKAFESALARTDRIEEDEEPAVFSDERAAELADKLLRGTLSCEDLTADELQQFMAQVSSNQDMLIATDGWQPWWSDRRVAANPDIVEATDDAKLRDSIAHVCCGDGQPAPSNVVLNDVAHAAASYACILSFVRGELDCLPRLGQDDAPAARKCAAHLLAASPMWTRTAGGPPETIRGWAVPYIRESRLGNSGGHLMSDEIPIENKIESLQSAALILSDLNGAIRFLKELTRIFKQARHGAVDADRKEYGRVIKRIEFWTSYVVHHSDDAVSHPNALSFRRLPNLLMRAYEQLREEHKLMPEETAAVKLE